MSGGWAEERAKEWLVEVDRFDPVWLDTSTAGVGLLGDLAALLREVEDRCVRDFTTEEPCPKCGLGISAQCYGCRMVAQRTDLLAEVRRVIGESRKALWAADEYRGADWVLDEILRRLGEL